PPVVRASPSCSIMIQVDKISGGRAGNVNLSVNGKRNGIWKTDGSGIFTLRGLTCGSSYEITPANSDLKFGPQSSTIANLKGQEKIAFLAIAREKMTRLPSSLSPYIPPPRNSPPSKLATIKFGDSLSGVISPQVSGCDKETRMLYLNDYRLIGRLGGDRISIDTQSPRENDLKVQIFGKDNRRLEAEPGTDGENLRKRRFVLPDPSEYKVRIFSMRDDKSDFQLAIARNGLTDKGYENQVRLVNSTMNPVMASNFYDALNFNLEKLRFETDRQTREIADQRIKKATQILERLAQADPDQARAHEMLSAIYLYYGNDAKAAADRRELAIRLKGSVRFRVKIGDEFTSNKRGERIEGALEDCWLLVRNGGMACESFINERGEIFFSPSVQSDKSNVITRKSSLALKVFGVRKYFRHGSKDKTPFKTKERDQYLIPLSGNKSESDIIQDTIIRLVQQR